MHPNLRPLSFGEILDGAFTLYRRNFVRLFGTSLAFGLAALVVLVVVGVTGGALIGAFGGGIALLGMLTMVAAVAGAVMALWGALTWQAARAYAGQKATLGDAVEVSMDSVMRLAGVGVAGIVMLTAAALPGMLIGVPLAAMGSPAPAIIFIVLWVLGSLVLVSSILFAVLPAVMLEDRGPLQAVSRSLQLASGALGRIAGVMLVALFITTLPGLGVEALTGDLRTLLNPAAVAAAENASLAKELVGWVLNLLTAPFLACVCVVLYYDRRVRTEALDVQMMTDRLAVAGD